MRPRRSPIWLGVVATSLVVIAGGLGLRVLHPPGREAGARDRSSGTPEAAGTLTVSTGLEETRFLLDGREVGARSALVLWPAVAPGRHSVLAEAPGHVSRSETVAVAPGQAVRLSWTLLPVPVAPVSRPEAPRSSTHVVPPPQRAAPHKPVRSAPARSRPADPDKPPELF